MVALNMRDLYIMNLVADKKEITFPIKKYGPKQKGFNGANWNKSICHELMLLEISNKYVLYRDDKSLWMIDTQERPKKREYVEMYPIFNHKDVIYKPWPEKESKTANGGMNIVTAYGTMSAIEIENDNVASNSID